MFTTHSNRVPKFDVIKNLFIELLELLLAISQPMFDIFD